MPVLVLGLVVVPWVTKTASALISSVVRRHFPRSSEVEPPEPVPQESSPDECLPLDQTGVHQDAEGPSLGLDCVSDETQQRKQQRESSSAYTHAERDFSISRTATFIFTDWPRQRISAFSYLVREAYSNLKNEFAIVLNRTGYLTFKAKVKNQIRRYITIAGYRISAAQRSSAAAFSRVRERVTALIPTSREYIAALSSWAQRVPKALTHLRCGGVTRALALLRGHGSRSSEP
ncbi:uncharacterized protein LOC120784175 [Xiphias gladius]|uniref:uncharacterized protein LOC120784175 n=1 Tax=Xiphias gladius TaxID=8245 RepID=UPI001A98D2B8|nr:uncharacterized protein LOC120784175 [Xiphias gladius]